MNTTHHNLEKCRSLISELPWNERNAVQSARIAVSKAVWLGMERDEVLRLIRTVPSASFLRQCPHILTATWETMTQANQLDQFMNEFDLLLNGAVETNFGSESLACNSFPTLTQANRNTAAARRHYRSSGKPMMLIKASEPKKPIVPEGEHTAALASIKGLPNDQKPKKLEFSFQVKGYETLVIKELPLSFDEGKPLRTDVQRILGRQVTSVEAQKGVDPAELVGKSCKVVVMHKGGSGGRPKAVVSLVQELPKDKELPVEKAA